MENVGCALAGESGRHEHLPRVRLPYERAGALFLLSSHSSRYRRSSVPAEIQRSEQPFSPIVPLLVACDTLELLSHGGSDDSRDRDAATVPSQSDTDNGN